jgi:hypothetical protein
MSSIRECHNYVRITGSLAAIEAICAADLEPERLFPPTATDLIDRAGWAKTEFGTAWVVNEQNNGPPHIHAVSNGGLGISSRFMSHEDPPITFYKKLHAAYPELAIYYEFEASHKQSVGYGEISTANSYASTHHYTTEQQLASIARSYHWRLPIYDPSA